MSTTILILSAIIFIVILYFHSTSTVNYQLSTAFLHRLNRKPHIGLPCYTSDQGYAVILRPVQHRPVHFGYFPNGFHGVLPCAERGFIPDDRAGAEPVQMQEVTRRIVEVYVVGGNSEQAK